MRTPLITDSLKKTEIDHKFLISTADLRTYGCGFETCVFKMENGEIDYLDIDRLRADNIEAALVDHELMCQKYEMVETKPAESYGTKNAVTVINITPEELLQIATDFIRLRDTAPNVPDGHVSVRLSETVRLVTKTDKVKDSDPYLQTK